MPRIGILPGDPSGIGPELVARLVAAEETRRADLLLIGDRHVFEMGQRQAGLPFPLAEGTGASAIDEIVTLHALHTIDPEEIVLGEVARASGHSVLRSLDEALELVRTGAIDALLYAPFNKAALALAGSGHADELGYMAEKLGVTGYRTELNVLDGMWTSRVTSHIALSEVSTAITEARIVQAAALLDRTMRRAGISSPRIAVAALNPHAGDGGNFGREELDVIAPAVRALARDGIRVEGPLPSDTVFLKLVKGGLDGVVTMYHDQGQIALKLLGFDRGVTLHGGLPIPICTPAHGSAFDIAGRGAASAGAIVSALRMLQALRSTSDSKP